MYKRTILRLYWAYSLHGPSNRGHHGGNYSPMWRGDMSKWPLSITRSAVARNAVCVDAPSDRNDFGCA